MRRPLRAAVVAPLLALTATALLPGHAFAQDGSDVGPGQETPPELPGNTVLVPRDEPTIQAGVDAAEPGGLVLVSAGVYREAVVVSVPFVTIRGVDRNRTILDGEFQLETGISVVEADGVAVENLTARNYTSIAIEWVRVFGYRASFVTAYNNGEFGLAAVGSVFGQFDHSYGSGHPGAAFAIDACNPCHAVVTDVIAEDNATGFNGTNAGGALLVVNSEWRDNGSGIVLNTSGSGLPAPQRDAVIAGNLVHGNNNAAAPALPRTAAWLGAGIVVDGGRDNLVTQNVVEDHVNLGIALIPHIAADTWLTEGNAVRANVVRGSGDADLALGAPAAGGDCFSDNGGVTSLPVALEWTNGCESFLRRMPGGSAGVVWGAITRGLEGGDVGDGDWRTQPAPPPRDGMPSPEDAPPVPATTDTVPHRVLIRDARTLDAPVSDDVSPEVSVLGFSLATSFFGLLIGVYAYALPLILYAAWVSIALWDLARQDAVPNVVRISWMAAVLALPVVGPIAYYAFGRSPIQRSLRVMLVGGGLAIYAVLAAIGLALAAA